MKTYAQIKPIPIENTIPGEEVIYKWLASRYTQIISLGTIYLFVLGFLYRSYRHAFFGIPNDSGESFADVAIFAVNVIVYFERSVSEAALKHIPAFVAILICAGFAAYGIQRWQQFFFGWASKVPETLWVALLMLMAVELSADIAKVAAKESAKLYRGIALDIAKGYPHREHPTLIIETTRTYAIAHASFGLIGSRLTFSSPRSCSKAMLISSHATRHTQTASRSRFLLRWLSTSPGSFSGS